MGRKNIITGTIILTAANLITRCMGFFSRVYLSNTIGAEGMGLYQLIMPVYALTWSITSAGFTTTISTLTAQEHIRGEDGNVGRIVKQSVSLSLFLSLLVSAILFLGAEEIACHLLKDGRASHPLQLLSLAIPFMSAGSCFRGFFFGMQAALTPALSQVLEQTTRILTIYLLAGIFVPLGLSYACLAAVAGIFLGELFSCGFTLWRYLHYKRKHGLTRKPSLSSFSALSMILTMAVPLSASRITASLLSTAENLLIPRQLQLHGQDTAQALATYGELTGMALPLILLPSSCLLAASVSLIPEISEASAVKQDSRIQRTVSASFLFTAIVGFGATALFAVFPKEICYIVYDRPALGQVLFPLAFLCPLLYAQTTLSGLLNGLGEQMLLFWNNILSSVISIAFLWLFMPTYGIAAFLMGWFLSLALSDASSFYLLWKRTGAAPSFPNCFGKPLLAGAAAGLLIKYLIRISQPSKLLFLGALAGMGILYLLFLLALGCLQREQLPFRKKT
ncbi:MAG: polysaccharide biosynthesis protein [Bacillota bacterium]|nr:polysaccharide biosynthesis protein [Bacillota bacterium]